MNKILLKIVLIQTIFMVACTHENEGILEINIDDIITMENLDEYMFRDDVQFVDLRNFEAIYSDGFIYSFEIIPFFDYLDNRAFNRNDSYKFEPEQLLNENEFFRLFDKEKSIFLFADGCIRSGYIKDILNYLGYEKVFVLGGFFEYEGKHKVLGDEYFSFGDSFSNKYYDKNSELIFYIYGSLNMDRKINDVRFDIIDSENTSLRSPNYSDSIDYNALLETLEDYILNDLITFFELHRSLQNMESNDYGLLLENNEEISSNILILVEELAPK